MEKLENLKTEAREELEKIMREGHIGDPPAPLKDYQTYFSTIRQFFGFADSPELKAKIIQRLVSKIEVFPKSFRIHYYVGQSVVVPTDWDPEPGPSGPGALKGSQSKVEGIKKGGSPGPGAALNFFRVTGSKTLTSGGPNQFEAAERLARDVRLEAQSPSTDLPLAMPARR